MCVGLAFAGGGIFGLVTMVPKMKALGSSLWPTLFLAVWTLGAIAITLFHAVNVFRREGIAIGSIQSEGAEFDSLTELQRLQDGGLISQDEFDTKKAEILRRL